MSLNKTTKGLLFTLIIFISPVISIKAQSFVVQADTLKLELCDYNRQPLEFQWNSKDTGTLRLIVFNEYSCFKCIQNLDSSQYEETIYITYPSASSFKNRRMVLAYEVHKKSKLFFSSDLMVKRKSDTLFHFKEDIGPVVLEVKWLE